MLQPTDDLSVPQLFKFLHGPDGGKIETPELARLFRVRGTCHLPNLFKQIDHRAFSDKSGAAIPEQLRHECPNAKQHHPGVFHILPCVLWDQCRIDELRFQDQIGQRDSGNDSGHLKIHGTGQILRVQANNRVQNLHSEKSAAIAVLGELSLSRGVCQHPPLEVLRGGA